MSEKTVKVDKLFVSVSSNAEEMGVNAADAIADAIRSVAARKERIRMMFAAAPSQDTTLAALLEIADLPWQRVDAFHMDEYVGITEDKSQSFRNFLKRSIFSKKPFGSVNYIKGDAADADNTAKEYAALLQNPMDIIVLGVGENGHIAFNDPPEARFDDPQLTRVITLSERSRTQQVNDGCFEELEEVPRCAITVTIPAFMQAEQLICVVPNNRKAEAIRNMLDKGVSETCPASILRTHADAKLFLDAESASLSEILK